LGWQTTARDRARVWTNRRVNPLVVAMLVHGFGPPTYAVVETIGGVRPGSIARHSSL
jgi:hypothetical protein